MIEKIQEDLKEALKKKDEIAVSTLRMLLAAVKNFEIGKGEAGYRASDNEIVAVVQKEIKSRKEAIEQFKKGNRQDLVDKETKETTVLKKYLPKQLSEEELRKLVTETIKEVEASSIDDTGRVMSVLSQRLKGKADMGLVSSLVRKELS